MPTTSQYAALGFDLFNTLIQCDVSRLPHADIGGKSRPTTLPHVQRILADAGHAVSLDQLGTHTYRISREHEAEKVRTGREFPAAYRWSAILAELDITPTRELVDRVVEQHMTTMCAAWDIAHEDRAALCRLAERYPLALLSNFDHGPSARRLLDRIGIAALFRYVGISDELGWRKPEARVFEDMLETLAVEPASCLFVGDSLTFDVAGAHALGMDTAWIAETDAPAAADTPQPAYRADNIAELEGLLSAATSG